MAVTSVYTPLRRPREFRLLQLDPVKNSENLACSLVQNSLDDCPEYEALSYSWGDPTITQGINCNCVQVQVTVNLYHALRSLRLRDEPRMIWVDALCIDQSNLAERSHQVRMMGDVYS